MKTFILRMILTVAKMITLLTQTLHNGLTLTQPSVLVDHMTARGHSGLQQNKAPWPRLAISCCPLKLHNCLTEDTVSFVLSVPGHIGHTAWCDYTRNVLILTSYSADGAQSEGYNETAFCGLAKEARQNETDCTTQA